MYLKGKVKLTISLFSMAAAISSSNAHAISTITFVANTKSDTAVPIQDATAPSVCVQIWSDTVKFTSHHAPEVAFGAPSRAVRNSIQGRTTCSSTSAKSIHDQSHSIKAVASVINDRLSRLMGYY
ncbi:hypothetical protein BKA58DRAFT_405850 [Alternaria rosae]|uniref:uncharacterized protein n=1 Tax=Alternaria rosae TaxID=1187941 RepID=UPI001E8EB305|nr:uncharacterized protein BKA58DRAFT_405850 [Alternaria rosae]KAH6859029.1 hypothetical protein BKA58DRAFT_405850 [Alternaria rosae]